jgi:hypothetical protein
MLFQPLSQGICCSVTEDIDDLTTFQIYQNGAISLTLPLSPIIHTHYPGHAGFSFRLFPDDPIHSTIAHSYLFAGQQSFGCTSASIHADSLLFFGYPVGSPGIGKHNIRKLFRKRSFWAILISAEKSLHLEDDRSISPGQINWITHVVAMYFATFSQAHRAFGFICGAFDK